MIAAGWAELDLCASHLDPALPTSDIALINAQAGGDPVPVDPLTATCLAAAREMWQVTGGAFDPTAGPVLDLWTGAAEPTDDQIAKARALIGMDKVQIAGMGLQPPPMPAKLPPGVVPPKSAAPPLGAVRLAQPGMRLDLGGIVEGYIIGRMAQRMKQAGAVAGLVSVADGPVVAFGSRPQKLVPADGDLEWSVPVLDGAARHITLSST